MIVVLLLILLVLLAVFFPFVFVILFALPRLIFGLFTTPAGLIGLLAAVFFTVLAKASKQQK